MNHAATTPAVDPQPQRCRYCGITTTGGPYCRDECATNDRRSETRWRETAHLPWTRGAAWTR